MDRVRKLFEQSGMTLEELGEKAGYVKSVKQSAWQFLQSENPSINALLRFCKALDVSVLDVLPDNIVEKYL